MAPLGSVRVPRLQLPKEAQLSVSEGAELKEHIDCLAGGNGDL